MITKEEAIDIIHKFNFFQGQRAGRELWFDKPFEVQDRDLENFSRDCEKLLDYIAGTAPTFLEKPARAAADEISFCDAWRQGYTLNGAYCIATREQERCHCDGDRRKCDFYPSTKKNLSAGQEAQWEKAACTCDGHTECIDEKNI